MFGVYEIITWDDVVYRLVCKFDTLEAAEIEKHRLILERKKIFNPTSDIPIDPVSYSVIDDIKYYLIMKNS